jgi:mono/diheme cytochrome c family protein
MKAVKLTNEEVANVMNYIQNSWGNKNDKMVTEKKVDKIRSGINP